MSESMQRTNQSVTFNNIISNPKWPFMRQSDTFGPIFTNVHNSLQMLVWRCNFLMKVLARIKQSLLDLVQYFNKIKSY